MPHFLYCALAKTSVFRSDWIH